ncbi:hypothetical protein JRO89_XS07G0231600 [Xanthoceras sorbifolium]|uniref:DNA-directed RNA polymerase III subunit RPC6 n=1 Tax=Xanthoceras sorbifolium TaxID=99658 RepID=A0ABQ8HUN4_9ROSI|nr:hypothetical protein JRO89_XS07G0231600 [Xanthoceras sorbifolium]
MSLKRKKPDTNSPADSLTDHERILFNLIKSKQDMGIWAGDMKREINLPNNIFTKSLKSLQAKNLIKEVVNIQNKGRKHFMAAEFEPSRKYLAGRDALKRSGVFREDLTKQQIEEILRALVLDADIVELKSNGLGVFANVPVGKVCYKSKGGSVGEPRIEAFASILCGVCPHIGLCTPDGIISPKTCEYYTKWFDF